MKKDLYLRQAKSDDARLLYEWRNDPETRAASFHQDEIPYEDHLAWFGKMMKDENRLQFILMDGDTPVGQIRLDLSPAGAKETGSMTAAACIEGHKNNSAGQQCEAEISYAAAPGQRGRGYGTALIRLIEKAAKEQNKEDISERFCKIALLTAKVLKDNTASAVIFERMGYKRTDRKDYLLFTKEI